MAMGRACAVHTHREDVPLEVHHIWPVGDGGPDTKANRVTICANAHGAVHDLIDKGRRTKLPAGPLALPWSIRRRYGARVRKLADVGWSLIVAARAASSPPS